MGVMTCLYTQAMKRNARIHRLNQYSVDHVQYVHCTVCLCQGNCLALSTRADPEQSFSLASKYFPMRYPLNEGVKSRHKLERSMKNEPHAMWRSTQRSYKPGPAESRHLLPAVHIASDAQSSDQKRPELPGLIPEYNLNFFSSSSGKMISFFSSWPCVMPFSCASRPR